ATIVNDDTASLSITAPSITETNADFTANFVVTLDHAVQGGFDVAISSSDGTADSSDYALNTTTLHFAGAAGESHHVAGAHQGGHGGRGERDVHGEPGRCDQHQRGAGHSDHNRSAGDDHHHQRRPCHFDYR